MKVSSVTAVIRGFVSRTLFHPAIAGVTGGVLVVAGIIGLLTIPHVAAEPMVRDVAPTTVVSADVEDTTPSPVCVPASYSLPKEAPLDTAPNGITVLDDGVVAYGVTGDSVDAVRDSLNACAPRVANASASGEFLAYTSYTVNWGYRVEKTGASTCRLADVKVGLRLNQLLPQLTTSSPGVATAWSTFMTNLTTHENGHKALDVEQANRLLASLQSLNGPCSSLDDDAQLAIYNGLQEFVTVNAEHDDHTHHGVDQGAVW